MPLVYKLLDHIYHACYFFGSLRMCVGRKYIHTFHILFTFGYVLFGYLISTYLLFYCPVNDLVVNIGKIGNEIHLITLIYKIPSYRVKKNHRSCITYMYKIVYSRSADIYFNLALLQRHKLFFSFTECVINLQFQIPLVLLHL